MFVAHQSFFSIKSGCFCQSFSQVLNPHPFAVYFLRPAAMVLPILFVTALLPIATLAANNWTHPCHTGECQWDLPAKQGSGTLRLVGFRSPVPLL